MHYTATAMITRTDLTYIHVTHTNCTAHCSTSHMQQWPSTPVQHQCSIHNWHCKKTTNYDPLASTAVLQYWVPVLLYQPAETKGCSAVGLLMKAAHCASTVGTPQFAQGSTSHSCDIQAARSATCSSTAINSQAMQRHIKYHLLQKNNTYAANTACCLATTSPKPTAGAKPGNTLLLACLVKRQQDLAESYTNSHAYAHTAILHCNPGRPTAG